MILGLGLATLGTAQIRVATWNVTSYGSGSTSRNSAFQTALFSSFQDRSFNPDVLVVQELQNTGGRTAFLNMLNSAPGQSGQWAAASFLDTGDTDSGFFYKINKVEQVGNPFNVPITPVNGIPNPPRFTQRYDFRLKGYAAGSTTNPNVSIYSSHWKSGTTTGGEDEARRLIEAKGIRADAANRPAGTHVILGGDFNVGGSNDDSYRWITDASVAGAGTNGRFFDPINSSFTSNNGGITWNNNNNYRFIHTQDPIGSGGMDDRLDFLMVGGNLRDGRGLDYIGSTTAAYSTTTWNDPNHSYRVWGNDGTSFNTSLTTTGNTMVGPTIAQALRDSTGNDNASQTGGHLPVFMDLRIPADLTVGRSVIDFQTRPQWSAAIESLQVKNDVDTSIWAATGIQSSTFQMQLIGNNGFLIMDPTNVTLAGGAEIYKYIQMDTSTLGAKSATLQLTDIATGQQRSIALSGIVAVPEPATMFILGGGLLALAKRRRS